MIIIASNKQGNNIPLTLDNKEPEHFNKELNLARQNGTLSQDGWEITVETHDVFGSNYGHLAIVIRGPNNFYASIDTFSLDDKGNPTMYAPGSEMRMALDQNRSDNGVTIGKPVETTTLFKGQGDEAIFRFAQIMEQAYTLNKTGIDYNPFSINSGSYSSVLSNIFSSEAAPEDDTKPEHANSISGPLHILKALGYNVSEIDGNGYLLPGKNDELKVEIPKNLFLNSLDIETGAQALHDHESDVSKAIENLSIEINPNKIAADMKESAAKPKEETKNYGLENDTMSPF